MPPTAYPISYTSAEIQLVGGQGLELGCSIPGWVEWVAFPRRPGLAWLSLRMRQACVFHDYCYRHGAATYGYGQSDCDYLLLEHAYRICRFINKATTVSRCVTDARKVLLGVRLGGSGNFKRADNLPEGLRDTLRTVCPDRFYEKRPSAADSLFDNGCASSYFEFNPYPTRSASYIVYRIADAPASSGQLLDKALYVFNSRQTGTRLTLVAWNKSDRKPRCVGYDLPAAFDFINAPPQVLRSNAPGGPEDWIVWWRRFDLDKTGGHLAMLAPRRATFDDWARIFPGAREYPISERDCEYLPITHNNAMAFAPASNVVLIGGRSHEDDANISELHPAPGLEPSDGKIRLMALRTDGCEGSRVVRDAATQKSRTEKPFPMICYHDFEIDPTGGRRMEQPPEPYVARDDLNRWSDGTPDKSDRIRGKNDGTDPDLYRNFVSPPFPLAAETTQEPESRKPILAWLRRGESAGETYNAFALLRRASHKGDAGRGFGTLKLQDFDEAAEPVFVLGRTSKQQSLASIQVSAGSIGMREWQLPPLVRPGTYIEDDCAKVMPGTTTRMSLESCAQETAARLEIRQECTRELDASWMVQRPLVLPPKRGGPTQIDGNLARIIFTRLLLRTESGDLPGYQAVLEARSADLKEDGKCAPGQARTYALNAPFENADRQVEAALKEAGRKAQQLGQETGLVKPIDEAGVTREVMQQWRDRAIAAVTQLRARPALVAEIDGDEQFLIVPNADKPWDSVVRPAP